MVQNSEKDIASHSSTGMGKITAPGPPISTLHTAASNSSANTVSFRPARGHWLRWVNMAPAAARRRRQSPGNARINGISVT
ncbi:Uncharacterised protein [Acinetobacter baumannii]|nr:Uncharacterised protein [Acinetobacter baumannii]